MANNQWRSLCYSVDFSNVFRSECFGGVAWCNADHQIHSVLWNEIRKAAGLVSNRNYGYSY